MKIYNKKRLVSAIICTVIIIASMISQAMEGFSIKLTIFSLIFLVIAYRDFTKSFSKQAYKEDVIDELDERNNLISKTSDAQAFKIVLNTTIVIEVVLLIIYGFTKEIMLIPAVIVLGFIVTLSFASSIISSLYYEKRL